MSNVRIAPRNFWDLMTLTGSVAPASGLGYTNTQSTDRSKFWRSPDTTAQTLRGSLATGSVTINWAALFRHHCHGGSAQFRAYSNNNWTGTLLVDTGVNAIYTPIATGYDHGYADTASADTHDPFGIEAPYSVFFTSAPGVKSVQWDFTSKSTTYGYAYWEVGRPFIGNYWEPSINPVYGLALGMGSTDERVRTRAGSLQTSLGARWGSLQMDFDGLGEDELPTFLDIMKQTQTSRDIAMSIFPGAGGRQERDGTVNGTFANLDPIGRQVNRITKRVQFEEN